MTKNDLIHGAYWELNKTRIGLNRMFPSYFLNNASEFPEIPFVRTSEKSDTKMNSMK